MVPTNEYSRYGGKMRYLLGRFTGGCLIAGLASAAVHAQTMRATTADEHAIRDLIALHASASQHDDFANLVGGYHVDADPRRSDGSIVSGRAAIERYIAISCLVGQNGWHTLARQRRSGFASCGRM
jgi:hypothetical protein